MSSKLNQVVVRVLSLAIAGSIVSCAQVVPDDGKSQKKVMADSIAVEEIEIADEFDLKTLTTSNVGQYTASCLNRLSDADQMASVNSRYVKYLEKVKLNPGKTSVTSEGRVDSANAFVYYGERGTCIAKSENQHPIFPIGAFTKTVNPAGISIETEKDWYRAIALAIAGSGQVRVVYRFSNGNAMVVRYWTKSIMELNYSSEFRKKGEWEEESTGLIFSDPALGSMNTTRYNQKMRKFPVFRHLMNKKSKKKPLMSASL